MSSYREDTPCPDNIPCPPTKWLCDYSDETPSMFDLNNDNNKNNNNNRFKDPAFFYPYSRPIPNDFWNYKENLINKHQEAMLDERHPSFNLNEIQIPGLETDYSNNKNMDFSFPLSLNNASNGGSLWSFPTPEINRNNNSTQERTWSTIASKAPEQKQQQQQQQQMVTNWSSEKAHRLTREDIKNLDIYMPRTVWLMIRVGIRKTNKLNVQRIVNQMCSVYSLLPEEFYQFYQEPKKTDNIVLQLSNKNYEKLNAACSNSDPKFIINDQQYPFRRVSPIVQCFLCFSFDHYNSNCQLGYKRCEYCSEKYTHGHNCECDNFCINCKNSNYDHSTNHSPKSLVCPQVFEKCLIIAERMNELNKLTLNSTN